MRRASRNKGVLDRDVGRREHNRRAQHAFRQRRKAAEAVRQRRIRQLEDAVEEMGRMLVSVCDEITAAAAAGDLAPRPGLMATLRSSIARSLELAGPIAAAADEDGAPLEMGDDAEDERRRDEPAGIPVPSQVVLAPPWSPSDVAPFAMRLVETTLSRACLYLSGDASISVGDYERAFGPSLRTHTQGQLLARLRWLLGPGRTSLHESSSAFRGPQHGLGLGLVTAADVQEQLRGLGARDLGPDTMELQIGGRRGPEDVVAPGMVFRLRTSLLTARLAYAAVCLDQGPAYPRHEVHKAVEASVVLARDL